MKAEKKRGAERTQRAVRDEWWTDERVKSFLDLEAPAGENPDFNALNKAYQGMVPESFARFIEFFLEAGRDLNAKGRSGNSIRDIIASHRNSAEYMAVIENSTAD